MLAVVAVVFDVAADSQWALAAMLPVVAAGLQAPPVLASVVLLLPLMMMALLKAAKLAKPRPQSIIRPSQQQDEKNIKLLLTVISHREIQSKDDTKYDRAETKKMEQDMRWCCLLGLG